jgi:hypothetical protein
MALENPPVFLKSLSDKADTVIFAYDVAAKGFIWRQPLRIFRVWGNVLE